MAKIMMVDDAAFMRKVIKDTLSKAGYTDLRSEERRVGKECRY